MKNLEFKTTNYPSDLTDEEWSAIESFIPVGNKSAHHKRSLVNAALYINKTGCQWRQLPRDYPPHNTVWNFFRRARENGLWEKIMDVLISQGRIEIGRK